MLNEQAAHAMSEQKSAQLHVQAQDHRIKELSAELSQIINTAGLMSASVDKSNADLLAARSELAEYRTQLDAMNQHSLDVKERLILRDATSRWRSRSFGKNRKS